jgi:hypothetical protein
VRRLLVIALAACAAFAVAPHRAAAADTCGIPNTGTLWIDFADGSVPFWQLFAQPGVIGAASNFIYPQLLRSDGAKTVYWDMHIQRRVGTPLEPFDPAMVIDRANRIYDNAAASMACANPIIAENELNGANLITPWSATNAQYRRDVLIYLQTLAARGARPWLLVPSAPFLGPDAADWWRQVAKVSSIVSESYFSAARWSKLGAFTGSRDMRDLFRNRIAPYTSIGIPTSKLGIMLGFHTTPGSGGRERAPLPAWLEVTKLQTLAAQEVASELKLRAVWSWGWGVFGKGSPEDDPDKPIAACVYLWTRSPTLCNGPKAAGKKFNTSLTEGQIILPRGARCLVDGKQQVKNVDIAGLTPVTGDADIAFTAAYARAVLGLLEPLKPKEIVTAEKAAVAARFAGSVGAYHAALAKAHATPAVARGVIADELRRARLETHMRVSKPSSTDVLDYYQSYGDANARLVQTKQPVPWLGNRRKGFALDANAPPQIFRLSTGQSKTIQTMLGPVDVQALDDTVPLGGLPFSMARPAVVTALTLLAKDRRFEGWLLARQHGYDALTLCRRDEQPTPGIVPLTDYLPFLAAD